MKSKHIISGIFLLLIAIAVLLISYYIFTPNYIDSYVAAFFDMFSLESRAFLLPALFLIGGFVSQTFKNSIKYGTLAICVIGYVGCMLILSEFPNDYISPLSFLFAWYLGSRLSYNQDEKELIKDEK